MSSIREKVREIELILPQLRDLFSSLLLCINYRFFFLALLNIGIENSWSHIPNMEPALIDTMSHCPQKKKTL